MRFESLRIQGFRRLVDTEIELGPRLTVVAGDNEVGKSSLHDALIRALYGFTKSERRKTDGVSDLDRCRPWRQGPNGYGLRAIISDASLDESLVGRLEVSWNFDDHHVTVRHADTGEDFSSSVAGRNQDVQLGEKLFGLSAADFIDVCGLRQSDITAVSASPTLKECLQNAVARRGGGSIDDTKERLTDAGRMLGLRAGTLSPNPRGHLDSLLTHCSSLESSLLAAQEERSRLDVLAAEAVAARRDADDAGTAESGLLLEQKAVRLSGLRARIAQAEKLATTAESNVDVPNVDEVAITKLRTDLGKLDSELTTLGQIDVQLSGSQERIAELHRETAKLAVQEQGLTPYEGVDASRLPDVTSIWHALDTRAASPEPETRAAWSRTMLFAAIIVALASVAGAVVVRPFAAGLVIAGVLVALARQRSSVSTNPSIEGEAGHEGEKRLTASLDAVGAPLAESVALRAQAYVTACERRATLMDVRVRLGELEREKQSLLSPAPERDRRAGAVAQLRGTIASSRAQLGIESDAPEAIELALSEIESRRQKALDGQRKIESAKEQLGVILAGRTLEELRAEAAIAETALSGHSHQPSAGRDVPTVEADLARAAGRRRQEEIRAEHLTTALATQEQAAPDPVEIEVELAQTKGKIGEVERYRDALKIAHETLDVAATETFRLYAPHLNSALAERLPLITGGRYTEAIVRDDLSILVTAPETSERVQVEELSRGTRDQILLAQRLAMANLLDDTAGAAPLLLDDPLAHLDATRLALAISVLSDIAEERQVVLFTEDERVVEIASSIGAHVVRLEMLAAATSA